MKHVLTIAGSDCSGGAGIQADLKAFSAMGVYGMTVITAVTAQNTLGVQAVLPLSPEMIQAQIKSIFSDIRVDGVKIGMLCNSQIIQTVAQSLSHYPKPHLVIDPVMISKSGHKLLDDEAQDLLKVLLLPLADLITPNLPEVEALLGKRPETVNEMIKAGEKLMGLGAKAVLVKGGHRNGDATDVLVHENGMSKFSRKRVQGLHSHGTGCTLASAIAALLARGQSLVDAVEKGKTYVTEGISHGIPIGGGCGPIHHFYHLYGGMEATV